MNFCMKYIITRKLNISEIGDFYYIMKKDVQQAHQKNSDALALLLCLVHNGLFTNLKKSARKFSLRNA